jgi:fructuronate reductase
LNDYADALCERFKNPFIAHETRQIAMDGSQKLPQRIFEPAIDALEKGQDLRPFVLATALWMRYCLGTNEHGKSFEIQDPRKFELQRLTSNVNDAENIVYEFSQLPGLIPKALTNSEFWNCELISCVNSFHTNGLRSTLDRIAMDNN